MTVPVHPFRILLGVTAGIAAYKAAELTRLFVKSGAEVQVVMTESARHFIGAATFQALSGRPARQSLWDEQAEAAMGHIELARWADVIVIAPASADFLARLTHGLADDLLATLCLASDRPIFVAPAMNRLMWANAATQGNVATLRRRGVAVIGPGSGEQACGETGDGRMSEPAEIAALILNQANQAAGPLAGIEVVVTAGPTREALDPVRFVSNRSSGRQGYAVAQALAARGARVTLVSGPVNLATPAGVRRVDVESAAQMLEATLAAMAGASLLVGTAAVADYRVQHPAEQKIKKTGETLSLELVRNPDIVAEVRRHHPDVFIVGFAAETENTLVHAREKLERKRLDLIAANRVGLGLAFDMPDNALELIWPGGHETLVRAPKLALAQALVTRIEALLQKRQQA